MKTVVLESGEALRIPTQNDIQVGFRSLNRSIASIYDLGVPIVAWFAADDQPIGTLNEVIDHRRAANAFSKDALNFGNYLSARQSNSDLAPSCVIDERGKKVMRYVGPAVRNLELPRAVIEAINGTSAGFSDCTVVVFGRFVSGTVFELSGGTSASYAITCGRITHPTSNMPTVGMQATGYPTVESDRQFLKRTGSRAHHGGGSLPFGDVDGSSCQGAFNSSCLGFVFGSTEWSVYYDGFLSTGTVPTRLGAVNYATASLGGSLAIDTYADIEQIMVFGGKLTKSQLREVEAWMRREAQRTVFWLGSFFPLITLDFILLLSGYSHKFGAPRYVENQLGGEYTHVNLCGNPSQTPFDILNNWEVEMEWRIHAGDVVVIWATDGAMDTLYDPLIADRAPEFIVQLREVCRRIKSLGGIPVVPLVPPWGSFYEPPGPGPYDKIVNLTAVNADIAAHPTEYSISAAGCPDLNLDVFNPAYPNPTYYAEFVAEQMLDAGHQLMAPLLTAAVRAVAPVATSTTVSVRPVASCDYLGKGRYLIYADESTVAASGAVAGWTAREGLNLGVDAYANAMGTAVNTWPLNAMQTGLAVEKQHCISMTGTQALKASGTALAALNGGANIAFALEFTPSAATAHKYILVASSDSYANSVRLMNAPVSTSGVKVRAYIASGGIAAECVTADLPLDIPAIIALTFIGHTLSVIGISYAAITPDMWIVPLASVEAPTVNFTDLTQVLINEFAYQDGTVAKYRRCAVWSPTDLTEVKNLLRFWSAKP